MIFRPVDVTSNAMTGATTCIVSSTNMKVVGYILLAITETHNTLITTNASPPTRDASNITDDMHHITRLKIESLNGVTELQNASSVSYTHLTLPTIYSV